MDLVIQGGFGVRLPDQRMRAGDVVAGHAHNFDHLTYVAHGALQIDMLETVTGDVPQLDGTVAPGIVSFNVVKSVVKRARDGFNFVLIRAGVYHRLTALEDDTDYHCIYVHRNADGEIVDGYDGFMPAYE